MWMHAFKKYLCDTEVRHQKSVIQNLNPNFTEKFKCSLVQDGTNDLRAGQLGSNVGLMFDGASPMIFHEVFSA